MGRKRKPTQLHVIEGTGQRSRMNPNEPMPDPVSDVPPAPTWLDDLARDTWKAKAEQLVALRILTSVDLELLETYCSAYSRMRRAEQVLDAEGEYYETHTQTGRMIRRHPAVSTVDEAVKLMKSVGAELGIGAAARPKINAGNGKTPANSKEAAARRLLDKG